MKRIPKQKPSVYKVNRGIIGHSIEITMERLIADGTIEGIEDRDLVYNDNEVNLVNPVTNIRSDKFELMLDEKIDYYNHKHKKINPDKTEENGGKEGAPPLEAA